MPRPKWQPNLLLGVVRYLYGTCETAEQFIELVLRRADEIAAVMAVRSGHLPGVLMPRGSRHAVTPA